MAQQHGIITLRGALGGLIFYQRAGKAWVRTDNSPSAHRLRNDPAFERSRENMREFGAAASAASLIRRAFLPLIPPAKNAEILGRLTARLRHIALLGAGLRGRRDLSPALHPHLLAGFNFDPGLSFHSACAAPYEIQISPQRHSATLHFPTLNPAEQLHAPQGATHFQLHLAIAPLSHFCFEAVQNKYQPLHPQVHAHRHIVHSGWIALDAAAPFPVTLSATFPDLSALPSDSALLIAAGTRFAQQINHDCYPLAQGQTLTLLS